MFHTLWTNSGCHGYHSFEFPVSWVIKFATVNLLYLFVSVTPYFFGFLSLRTFHSLLGSPQAFAFCTPVSGGIECYSQDVWSSRKPSEVPQGLSEPQALQCTPSLLKSVLLEIPASLSSPHQHLCSSSTAFLLPGCLCAVQCTSSCPVCRRGAEQLHLFSPGAAAGTSQSECSASCWNSHRLSAGIWWDLRVPVSAPTITKGLHLADGIWGPWQHC